MELYVIYNYDEKTRYYDIVKNVKTIEHYSHGLYISTMNHNGALYPEYSYIRIDKPQNDIKLRHIMD